MPHLAASRFPGGPHTRALADRSADKGFTLIELLIVVAVVAIVAAIAVPGLLRARASSNEASAIGSLRTINSSQAVFSNTCGNRSYAATLAVLGTAPAPGVPAFISPDLGGAVSASKSGYLLTMAGTPVDSPPTPACNGGAMVSGYYAMGAPQRAGVTGTRYFWTNTSGAIYSQSAAFASVNEASIPASDPQATPLR